MQLDGCTNKTFNTKRPDFSGDTQHIEQHKYRLMRTSQRILVELGYMSVKMSTN